MSRPPSTSSSASGVGGKVDSTAGSRPPQQSRPNTRSGSLLTGTRTASRTSNQATRSAAAGPAALPSTRRTSATSMRNSDPAAHTPQTFRKALAEFRTSVRGTRRLSALSPTLGAVMRGHSCISAFVPFLERCAPRTVASFQFCMQVASYRRAIARRPPLALLGDVPATATAATVVDQSTYLSGSRKPSGAELDAEALAAARAEAIEDAMSLALSLYERFISMQATQPLRIPASVRQQVVLNISKEDGDPPHDAFDPAVDFLMHKMESRVWPAFRRSREFAGHIMRVLEHGQLTLLDILLNHDTMACLREHLERSGGSYGSAQLQFWLTVDAWVHNLVVVGVSIEETRRLEEKEEEEDDDGDEARSGGGSAAWAEETERAAAAMRNQEDAMAIYERHVSMQARAPVGAADRARIEIECNICAEDGPPPSTFAKLQAVVFAKLEEKHLQTFLQSPLWQQYVREIDGTARQGGRDSEGQLESEESHSDSEHDDASAVHEGRTGHDAAESDAERKARLAREESERRQRFALGRVNEWGVYVRDQTTEQAMVALEPSLNEPQVSRVGLFKTVDRRERDQKALEIAQSIIAEVARDTRRNPSTSPLPASDALAQPPSSVPQSILHEDDAI